MNFEYHLANLFVILPIISVFTVSRIILGDNSIQKPKLSISRFLELILLAAVGCAIIYAILHSLSFNASLENIFAASGKMQWSGESPYAEFVNQFNLVYFILGKLYSFGAPLVIINITITSLIFSLYITSYFLIIRTHGFDKKTSIYLSLIMLFGNTIWLYFMQFYSIPSVVFKESHGIIGLGLAFLCFALGFTRHYVSMFLFAIILLFTHPTNFLNILCIILITIVSQNFPRRLKQYSLVILILIFIALLAPLNILFREEESIFLSYLNNWDFHRSPNIQIAEVNFAVMLGILLTFVLTKSYLKNVASFIFLIRIQLFNFVCLILSFFVIRFDQLSAYNILIFSRISNLVGLIISTLLVLHLAEIFAAKMPRNIRSFISDRIQGVAITTAISALSLFTLHIADLPPSHTPMSFNKSFQENLSGICSKLGDGNILTNSETEWILRGCGAPILSSTTNIDWIPYHIGSIRDFNKLLQEVYGLDLARANKEPLHLTRFAFEPEITSYWLSLSKSDWQRIFCKYKISSVVTLASAQIAKLESDLAYQDESFVSYRVNSFCSSK